MWAICAYISQDKKLSAFTSFRYLCGSHYSSGRAIPTTRPNSSQQRSSLLYAASFS